MNKRYVVFTILYLSFLVLIVILANNRWVTWVFASTKLIPLGDKLGHLVLFGLLSYLLNSALNCRHVKVAGQDVLLGGVIVFILALLEEASQVFIRARNFEVLDVLFDLAGIYIFGLLARKNFAERQRLKADTN